MGNSPKADRSTPIPRDPRPRLRLVPSAPAKPEIAVESFYEARNELVPLFVRFHAEQGKDGIELDPDWDQLLRMTAAGVLRVVTVRDEGTLVGFMLNVVNRPLFYGALHGSTIAYWLDPVYRAGWFPVKLFRRNLDFLKEWGCVRVFIAADTGYKDGRMGRVFERLGYHVHETHYAKVL